jgi:hypothetical protein
VTIIAVDSEVKIRAALPDVRGMVQEGLVLILDAELIADEPPVARKSRVRGFTRVPALLQPHRPESCPGGGSGPAASRRCA